MAALWELHDFGYYLLQQLLGPDNDKALPILTDLTRVAWYWANATKIEVGQSEVE